jgi:peptidyl-prolyl cis-trans isomerase D
MVEARHILIRLDPEADEEAVSAAKLKAEAIYKMASDGQDFAELAKTHSEGPTKDRGGYLGKFGQSQMVKPFADKAFSMAPGEISRPVKTQFGWHVIKVESIEEAATQTLEQSKPQIVDKLTDRKARNLAYDKAEQFYESVYEKDDLVNHAQTFELTVMETGAFNRQGPEALGQDKSAFATAAFALALDEISDIQDIGGRYYLIQQTEAIDAEIPPLETVIAEVAADLTQKMQTDRARADADKMAADLQAGITFEKSAGLHDVAVAQTDLFGRNADIPNIGSDPAFGKAAFELIAPGDLSQEPVEGSAGLYLLRLVERKAPEVEGFEKERDDIKAMLLRQKQMALFQDWLEARKADSQIDKQQEYLE